MPDVTPIQVNRVLPSLLDRLAAPEDSAEGTAARRLSSGGGVYETGAESLTESGHRDTVLRDLEWLFNASSPLALVSPEVLRRCPNVARSVLNYGLRGVVGAIVTDLHEVERRVSQAVAWFEPRIVIERQSLRASKEGQLIEIEIEATLLTQRAARRLIVRTELELERTEVRSHVHG